MGSQRGRGGSGETIIRLKLLVYCSVPKWINTANVLYYTVQLAIPLVKIMKSTSVGSSMKQVLDKFDTIGSDVESVAKVNK